MDRDRDVRIGCAGWGIPRACAARFPDSGSHLERYAARLGAVEINSSFYRPHRRATYERWAASVPDSFRFSVKLPRAITHQGRLGETSSLGAFLDEAGGLGSRLGPLLVQLPPSLRFDAAAAGTFFRAVRLHFDGGVACEPRHPSWFGEEAADLLATLRIARVAADPPRMAEAAGPGGWDGLVYHRLHGSPRRYYSSYTEEYLDALALRIGAAAASSPVWCVFDNTALGAAAANALDLAEKVQVQTTLASRDGRTVGGQR